MTYSHTQKRKILTSALFQHSTKTQAFKHTALCRITERIVYFSCKKRATVNEIQNVFREELGYNLPLSVFEKAIDELLNENRIEKDIDEITFILSEAVVSDIKLIQADSEKSYIRLTNKLFHTPPDDKAKYVEPFWAAMNFIFANIGELSAKLVSGKVDKEAVLNPILKNCMSLIRRKFRINYEYFYKRIQFFFEDTKEPIYNEFRWILAQNYFITSSLGINPESELFSYELFKDSTLYLDTNVILSLISPNNKQYNNVTSLIEATKKLEMQFCLSSITCNEYEGWVQSEGDKISLALNQIPKKTKSKIGSCIYQDYLKKTEEVGIITNEEKKEILNEVVAEYLDYKAIIKKHIPDEQINYIDDLWFEAIENDATYDEALKIVKEKYLDVCGRKKSVNAAIHDAKLLLWLEKEIKETKNQHWLVTSDYSLPLIKLNGAEKSSSIILEAILQWLVPLTSNGDAQEKLSQVLKHEILPKEFLFEVSDFVIFEELHMECSELPSEDVEDCILFIKKNAQNLNPTKAEDREKLATYIAKYFNDPGRKYKLELTEREKENEILMTQLGDVSKLIDVLKKDNEINKQKLENTKEGHKLEINELKSAHDKKMQRMETSIEKFSEELNSIKSEKKQEKIRKELNKWKRPSKISFIAFVILLIFGILELSPDWGWNYPAKLLNEINSISTVNTGLFRIYIGLNIFLLSGLLIALFAFSYSRLFNSEKIETRKEYLETKID